MPKHPISQALSAEVFAAFRERREARPVEETLAQFPDELVSEWRAAAELEAQEDAKRAADDKQKKIDRRIKARLAGARIPPRYREVTYASLIAQNHPEAMSATRDLSDLGSHAGRQGLILSGEPGNGKTTLAIAALRRFVERTSGLWPARFFNVNRGLQAVRESFDRNDGEEDNSILDLCHCNFVVLDDLDKVGHVTRWVRDQMYTLIDTLYVQERRIIVTTNLATEDLFEHLDESLASRLMEMCAEVQMAPHDYRAA